MNKILKKAGKEIDSASEKDKVSLCKQVQSLYIFIVYFLDKLLWLTVMVLLKYRINYRLENQKSIKRTEFERVLTLTYLHSFLQTFSTITKHITLLFIIHSYCAVKPLRTINFLNPHFHMP